MIRVVRGIPHTLPNFQVSIKNCNLRLSGFKLQILPHHKWFGKDEGGDKRGDYRIMVCHVISVEEYQICVQKKQLAAL